MKVSAFVTLLSVAAIASVSTAHGHARLKRDRNVREVTREALNSETTHRHLNSKSKSKSKSKSSAASESVPGVAAPVPLAGLEAPVAAPVAAADATLLPSDVPSAIPSELPSDGETDLPTLGPSASSKPSGMPSDMPSDAPSSLAADGETRKLYDELELFGENPDDYRPDESIPVEGSSENSAPTLEPSASPQPSAGPSEMPNGAPGDGSDGRKLGAAAVEGTLIIPDQIDFTDPKYENIQLFGEDPAAFQPDESIPVEGSSENSALDDSSAPSLFPSASPQPSGVPSLMPSASPAPSGGPSDVPSGAPSDGEDVRRKIGQTDMLLH